MMIGSRLEFVLALAGLEHNVVLPRLVSRFRDSGIDWDA